MPPKGIASIQRRGHGREQPGYARTALSALVAQENRSVVIAVGVFAAAVTFFHSNWSEILIPA
ncbi:hypothetical protein M501DRAFT_994198 [Patellaria atrata CBS 101060]|uniref:TOM core complex subunit Tom6 n=1 Tax=Patellaria atrata CBS 101060 TaxID=1346257 RepID=A0A9P4SJ66_9PEZI|nr:hypothetical protein M501DRAFT_994198 [Patellaria atrata CBS 101060]